jgi:hypothetical protein
VRSSLSADWVACGRYRTAPAIFDTDLRSRPCCAGTTTVNPERAAHLVYLRHAHSHLLVSTGTPELLATGERLEKRWEG